MTLLKNIQKSLFTLSIPLMLISCGESEPQAPELSFAETFQTQLIEAQPGDVIAIPSGVHEFTRSLSLTVPGVTLRGEGMDESILSFKNQAQGAEGLLVSADDFTIEDLAIEDPIGDALKINQSTNVIIRRVRTEWTRGAHTENGAYGIYPVQTTNLLIDGAVAIGASDAGIYVGQSNQIIVRNSRAEFNVAGIEIENSTFADVYDNVATNNTGGILVFDLPNLPVQGGQSTRIFNNEIFGNNQENFAPEGNIVGNVPAGSGLLVLANDNIEVFGNRFEDNKSLNIMIYSFVLNGRVVSDENYDPYPEQIYVHDNNFVNGGEATESPYLVPWFEENGSPIPNVVWGGLIKDGGSIDKLVCLGAAGDQSFLNLNGAKNVADASTDATPHRCSLPRLPPVSLDLAGDD